MVQFQDWSNGRLIYGIPGNANSISGGTFEQLTGVFLLNAFSELSGEGGFVNIYPNTDIAYCGAAWYAANKDGSMPEALKVRVAAEKCPSVRSPDIFTSPHSKIILE